MSTHLSYHKAIFLFHFLLIVTIETFAQNQQIETLTKKFQQYQIDHFQEKLFVHTDKSFYLSGEQIWLKVYVTDGFFHKLSNLSKVAYIEILDKTNTALIQAKIAIGGGTGNTSIQIPTSLLSGNYLLRAYTQWMRNGSPDYYYEQPIQIINTLSESNKNVIETPKRSIDIQFFPEGGYLVNGLPSNIGFKVIDESENGVDCQGVIINQKKDTIVKFKPLKFGMGHFLFSPEKEAHYTALIKIKDSIITKDLPAILNLGYTMMLTNPNDQTLKIRAQSSGLPKDETIYLLVHSGSLLKSVQSKQMLDGSAIFAIDKSILEDGLSHFTLFNSNGEPVCERLFFKSPQKRLDIQIQTASTEFSSRNLVNLSINTQTETGKPIPANMSISVFMSDSLSIVGKENSIQSYLLLTSDLKGYIESPKYYFDEQADPTERASAIDNLLLTQGWSRFRWNEVLAPIQKEPEFLPEKEGMLVHGKIISKNTGLSMEGVLAYLSVPSRYFKFASSISNASGDIFFNQGDFYGSTGIIIQPSKPSIKDFLINMINPFSSQFSSTTLSGLTINKSNKSELLYRSIASQAENIYHKINTDTIFNNADTLTFYGKPDKTYYLDDYTRFTSMEEVLKEYVSEVQLKKTNNEYHLKVWNAKYKTFENDEPLVLFDGVPIKDINKIIAYDPLKVRKIEVVTQNNYSGTLISNGIISFSTYSGDMSGLPLDANALLLPYDGLQAEREFYSPVYKNNEQKESHLPDLRNLLFWSSNLVTDKSGKTTLQFHTSDLKGRFAIVVQGITNLGTPGYSLMFLNIK